MGNSHYQRHLKAPDNLVPANEKKKLKKQMVTEIETKSFRQIRNEAHQLKVQYGLSKSKKNRPGELRKALDKLRESIPDYPSEREVEEIRALVDDLLSVGNGHIGYYQKNVDNNRKKKAKAQNPLTAISIDILDKIFDVTHVQSGSKYIRCRHAKIKNEEKNLVHNAIDEMYNFIAYLKYHLGE